MSQRRSSRSVAQLTWLESLPAKFDKAHWMIEAMASLHADDQLVRSFCRMCDELKSNADQLGLIAMADSAGHMSSLARRGGGLQMRVRGLGELLGNLKVSYEGALKSALAPGEPTEGGGPGGTGGPPRAGSPA